MRWSWWLGAMVAGIGASACDGGFDVENGRPRVSWVALESLAGERAALTLWVQDAEGDPVDVTASWQRGSESGAVALAAGSPPLIGLPTQLGLGTVNGQPHRVVWDLGGVPAGAVTLTIRVDDRPHAGDDGDAYRVEGVDPRQGGGPLAATRVL